MKNCNGDWKISAASDVKAESVADAMEQLQIIRISIRDGNRRSLFFNLKRDLRHFRDSKRLLHNIFSLSLDFRAAVFSLPRENG